MFDLVALIETVGYIGLFAIVFAESGLLLGAVLPGDSLLFTAGFLASQEYLNIYILVVLAFAGAVLGDNVGYWLGKKFGPAVFRSKTSLLLNEGHIERSRAFFAKHGAKTIVLARFVPFVRTLAPILAGVGHMHRSTFLFYNVIGALIWAVGIPVAGYILGNTIPGVDQYLLPIILLIIIVSVSPGAYHFLRERENRQLILRKLRSLFS